MGITSILFALVVGILLYLIFNFGSFTKENDIIKERLETIKKESFKDEKVIKEDKINVEVKNKKKLSEILQNIGKIIAPGKIKEGIRKKLDSANIPLKENEFIAIVFFVSLMSMSFAWMTIKNIYVGLIVGFIGYLIPNIWLKMKISKRRKQFEDQMLDTLVMLSNSMKAGYSFLQGLDLISKECPPPTSVEFQKIVKESSLGIDLEKSMGALNERMQSEDFDLVVTVIMIQRQIGGNLSEILDGIAETIRERIRIKGEINTLTAQARLSGIIVALLPVGIFLVFWLIRPDLMKNFFTFKQGWFHGYYMLLVGAFMQFIGFMIIRQITNIEV
jgi:tight adherence protein B